jgi:hypothetical protein
MSSRLPIGVETMYSVPAIRTYCGIHTWTRQKPRAGFGNGANALKAERTSSA